MKNRYIEVKKCSPDECPYCTPSSYASSVNLCKGREMEVSASLKYFPKFCPLDEMKEENNE